jgi:hypothetical protein
MCRRESHARHPRLALGLLVDPGDCGVNHLGPAIGPRSNVGRWHLIDRSILIIYHERRHVMPAESGKIDIAGYWVTAPLVWIKDATGVSANTTWRLRPGFSDHLASVIGSVAGNLLLFAGPTD